ncbi:MAG TPA: O-antigen ligase family protein [Vicinamibacterales bacterium]|jgi:O-antigen ligase|nr:O-antigen ligase family protein [Vicinamibacterales bacterium]
MTERLTFNAPVPTGASLSAGGGPTAVAASEDSRVTSAAIPAPEPRDRAFTWMLLFTAVLFLRPQDILPPLDFLHLAELSATIGLVSLVAGRLARRQPVTRVTPELIGVVLFGAVIVLTAPFSIWMGGAIGVFRDVYSKVILIYLLAVNTITTPKRLERLTWVLVLSVGYVAFLTMIDYLHGSHMVGHGTRAQGAVGGIMGNPNDLATNMVAFLPLAAFLVLRRSSLLERATAAGCAVLMLASAVASGSRGGFLGMIVMIVVFGVMAVRKRPGLVVAAAFAGMCALPLVPATYWHRIASITDESKDDFGSAQERRTLIKDSIRAFSENPLTGVGAGNFKAWDPTRPSAWHESHNVVLQVAAELGIVGLSVFFFMVGRAFYGIFQTRRLLRRARRAARTGRNGRRRDGSAPILDDEEADLLDAHSAAMLASLCGWLVCALFASVAYTWPFYYLLALAVTPREMLRDRQPRTSTARVKARAHAVEVAHA